MARRGGRRRGRRTGSQRRASQRAKRASRSPSKSSPSSKTKSKSTKKKKVNRARQKLNKKIQSKKLSTKVKSVTKAVAKKKADAKKKTISASQSRKQVRQKTKQKIATRKKINMPSLGRIGRTLRNIRQPMSGLSSMAINSVMGRPGIASTIAQAAVNNLGKQNQRTRDMSKLSPQQQRKYQRLSEKTGRDYSIRNPTFRLNMNMKDIAKFAGLDKQGWYNKVPASIRNAQVNKQFYGNPMKKGWHSSQRTGRGQGISDRRDQYARPMPIDTEQIPSDFGRPIRGILRERMGPQQDWLSQLYSSHNISGGKLDQGARDYWSNEAKTKGRDAVMQSIIGTSKAQGTYGGRKKPRSLNLQAKGTKRRQGMLAKTLAATMAARGI